MRLIESICKRLCGSLRLGDRGVAAIEAALVFPVLTVMTFGIVEIGLIMATQVTLEGGLKEASRYGITGQGATEAERIANIKAVLKYHAIDLVNFDEATFVVETIPSFSLVGKPEPFVDAPETLEDGTSTEGCHDNQYTKDCEWAGDVFLLDCDGNGLWDDKCGAEGAGIAGEVVSYTVTVPWHVRTPVFDRIFGEGEDRVIPLSATIVVRNEPNLYNQSSSGSGTP